jgi:hypothetical protein
MADTENRVYLFREIASAFLTAEPGLIASSDAKKRSRARAALAELARVACIVAGDSVEEAEAMLDAVMDDVEARREAAAKAEKKAVRTERKARRAATKSARRQTRAEPATA